MATIKRDMQFNAQQQEDFSQLVVGKLRSFDWTRTEAATHAGVGLEKVSTLSRTAPVGMAFGTFLRVMLALDIDLYEVCTLLGLDTEVKTLMADPELRTQYPNAQRHFIDHQDGIDPLTALVSTLPADKQAQARTLLAAIMKSI